MSKEASVAHSRTRSALWLTALLLPASLLFAGCNRGPEMGQVSGVVKLDGEPLKFGRVMFQQVSGGQPATGEIQPDGSFVLSTFAPEDGALVGKHRIRVVCYSSQDPANQGPVGDALGQLLIPGKYASLGSSGLSAEVQPGENEPVVLELTSGQ